jgi:site-specific DNA recombinase
MRWNAPTDWIISAKPAHPALVSEADFVTVQHLHADRPTAPGRTYLLAGLLHCALCERRVDSHCAHRPAYRCRHGHTSATPSAGDRAPNAYIREDQVLPHLPALLIRLTDHQSEPEGISPADAVERLRTMALTLTLDATARTLTTDTPRRERITIG